jgi:hypothetical protein
MRVTLTFRVPVVVVVDLDAGEVDRVAVLDEELVVDGAATVYDTDTAEPLPMDADHLLDSLTAVAKARTIAEAQTWPSWEFGW